MADSILVAKELRKSYGDTEAVKGIDLEIKRGEVFGLLGPNGAGKTTTISMLTGLLEPSEGRMSIDGEELTPRSRKLKAKIGLVPQELALYPTLSARTNLQFFGRLYGLRGEGLRDRVNEVLDMVELSDRADDPVSSYSGGMKRRINIAAGLLHRPAILFLDEPTVGVDPQSRNAIFEGVEALNRDGMTVIYTTHYMEEAQRLCERVAIVDEGRIVALDSPSGLIGRLGGGIILLAVGGTGSEQIFGEISEIEAVRNVATKDGRLVVETTNLQPALSAILELTAAKGLQITFLEMLEPSLESVFLHLTGKNLRE